MTLMAAVNRENLVLDDEMIILKFKTHVFTSLFILTFYMKRPLMVYQGKSSFVPQVKHKQQEEIKDILKNKRSRGCLHQQKSSYLELSTTQYIYVINL